MKRDLFFQNKLGHLDTSGTFPPLSIFINILYFTVLVRGRRYPEVARCPKNFEVYSGRTSTCQHKTNVILNTPWNFHKYGKSSFNDVTLNPKK